MANWVIKKTKKNACPCQSTATIVPVEVNKRTLDGIERLPTSLLRFMQSIPPFLFPFFFSLPSVPIFDCTCQSGLGRVENEEEVMPNCTGLTSARERARRLASVCVVTFFVRSFLL